MQQNVRTPNSIQPISGQELRQYVFCREERRNIPVPVELTSQVEVPKVTDARGGLHATEDDVLVAAAMKGEATAFAMLVERHEKRIFFTAPGRACKNGRHYGRT